MNYASLIIIFSIVLRSSAGLQLHGGEAGRDGGGHGRRSLLAVKERLPGTDSSRLLFHSFQTGLESDYLGEMVHYILHQMMAKLCDKSYGGNCF